jgi:transketolase
MELKKVAIIILYDSEMRFLLQHRSKDAKLLPNHWAFFGGEIKKNENPEDAVRREAYEELNYEPKSPKLVIEQNFEEDHINGYMYVYTDFFDRDKCLLTLQEGQGWGWYKESEMSGLKMIDRDRQIINLIIPHLSKQKKAVRKTNDNSELEKRLSHLAREIRKMIIEVACKSKSAHVGSSLSCVDLLVSAYFYELDINKDNWDKRDIFILSKAHAAMALYAVLTLKGLITKDTFEKYYQNDGSLPAHLDRFTIKGIEVSVGSLGHGFNMALGMAYAYKLKKDKRKVFALIGDGESQEGSIWEGALFASKLKIDNLTAILDYNNLQGYGHPREICSFEPIMDKWRAFGWQPYKVNGHNFSEIIAAFEKPHNEKPKIIIADTVKGKGVSFMENQLKWHYYLVTDEFKEKALQELR